MLRFTNYSIVFQEVPDEVTMAINISNCPNHCKGCHSPYLMEDIGEILDEESLSSILDKYTHAVTCVCFMGGDAEPDEVEHLAWFIKNRTNGTLKTGWYSGKEKLPQGYPLQNFNFIKLGAYEESLGGLDSNTTNQRFYQIENEKMIDITYKFHKNTAQWKNEK